MSSGEINLKITTLSAVAALIDHQCGLVSKSNCLQTIKLKLFTILQWNVRWPRRTEGLAVSASGQLNPAVYFFIQRSSVDVRLTLIPEWPRRQQGIASGSALFSLPRLNADPADIPLKLRFKVISHFGLGLMNSRIPGEGSKLILISWDILRPVIISELIFNQADLKALRNKNVQEKEWGKKQVKFGPFKLKLEFAGVILAAQKCLFVFTVAARRLIYSTGGGRGCRRSGRRKSFSLNFQWSAVIWCLEGLVLSSFVRFARRARRSVETHCRRRCLKKHFCLRKIKHPPAATFQEMVSIMKPSIVLNLGPRLGFSFARMVWSVSGWMLEAVKHTRSAVSRRYNSRSVR